jgi:hypothetical protein
VIVLVPAYEPDQRLPELVTALLEGCPGIRVLVVDDGSGPVYRPVFDEARRRGCLLLGYPVNRGKGHALKSGFRYLAEEFGTAEDVVCADSDGQHSAVDILAVAERVRVGRDPVLGVRRFTGGVPLRSKVGNATSRMLFAMASGCDLRDTQTGLRGYPGLMIAWLGAVPGDRFEYEMNVLLSAGQAGYRIEELTIATIYIGHNASSHFRPVVDSIRVLAPLLRFSASGLLAFAVDLLVVLAVHGSTGGAPTGGGPGPSDQLDGQLPGEPTSVRGPGAATLAGRRGALLGPGRRPAGRQLRADRPADRVGGGPAPGQAAHRRHPVRGQLPRPAPPGVRPPGHLQTIHCGHGLGTSSR